ncbi:MAG: DNA translocase FtsK 4TM domain-containing protein, partial [Candidatus Spechtbacterales bacterium]|nr:DNA translocase FtsK 4TM domain-containing protein [Candidatus Spechtbacterales bacterium]
MAKKKKKRSKKKKSSKSSKKKKKKLLHELDPGVKRGIWSVLLVVIALLSVLSFFEKAGQFGELFSGLLSSIFGWGMYVVPIILTAVAIGFIFSWNRETNKPTLWAAFLFFSSILGIFAVSGHAVDLARERGGMWGELFIWPLVNFVGIVGSWVVLIALVIISIIMGFHIKVDKIMEKIVEKRKLKKSALKLDIKDGSSKKEKKNKKKEKKKKKKEQGAEKEKKDVDVKDYNKDNKNKDEKSSKSKENDFTQFSEKKFANYEFPSTELLEPESGKPTSGDIVANANIIKRTLENFGIDVEMGEVNVGPTVTQYTLKPAEGVKLSRITALGNDLSLALAAHPIRIEAPIPGRSLVGIEIPNKATTWVRLRDLLESPGFRQEKGDLIMAAGRNVKGAPVYADLSKMPHMLIAGSTGSGKTIALNAVILSLLFRNHPRNLRLILIDPKRVEFPVY